MVFVIQFSDCSSKYSLYSFEKSPSDLHFFMQNSSLCVISTNKQHCSEHTLHKVVFGFDLISDIKLIFSYSHVMLILNKNIGCILHDSCGKG